MKKLRYRYSLRIEFDSPITNHNFKVRCTPVTDERQKILQQNIHIYQKNSCVKTGILLVIFIISEEQSIPIICLKS